MPISHNNEELVRSSIFSKQKKKVNLRILPPPNFALHFNSRTFVISWCDVNIYTKKEEKRERCPILNCYTFVVSQEFLLQFIQVYVIWRAIHNQTQCKMCIKRFGTKNCRNLLKLYPFIIERLCKCVRLVLNNLFSSLSC